MVAFVAAGTACPSRRCGAAQAGAVATPAQLDYAFAKTSVQPIFMAKRPGLVRCIQCHTRLASSLRIAAAAARGWRDQLGRGAVAEELRDGRETLVSPGAPTTSRLLRHPLAEAAGGESVSQPAALSLRIRQDAPEWRILAAWVRGHEWRVR